MSILQKLKSLSSDVDARYKKYKEEAPAREAAELKRLESQAAREKKKATFKRQRLEAKTEVTQAKSALNKAQRELKANKGGGFDLNSLIGKKKPAPVHRFKSPVHRPRRRR